MEIKELNTEARIILHNLRLTFSEVLLDKNLPKVFVIEAFGSILASIPRRDYIQVLAKLEESYPGYRYMFLTQDTNLLKAKDKIIWELMRSGYMRYIRLNYPLQFRSLLTDHGYYRKIINERLRIWGNKARFKFLVEENQVMLEQPPSRILAMEPDFFDYMPEEE